MMGWLKEHLGPLFTSVGSSPWAAALVCSVALFCAVYYFTHDAVTISDIQALQERSRGAREDLKEEIREVESGVKVNERLLEAVRMDLRELLRRDR